MTRVNILFFVLFSFLYTEIIFSTEKIDLFLDPQVVENSSLPFLTHVGPGQFASALALNVQYEPIKKLLESIETHLGKKLKIFTGWNPEGEAHVTTITPPEYFDVLKEFVSIDEINNIAREFNIQKSELKILGIGSGKVLLDGISEETFFVIVRSERLIQIRGEIQKRFVERGGDASKFDASKEFYPHITIGFTKRDLHVQDGVIKDVEHSFDSRFNLKK